MILPIQRRPKQTGVVIVMVFHVPASFLFPQSQEEDSFFFAHFRSFSFLYPFSLGAAPLVLEYNGPTGTGLDLGWIGSRSRPTFEAISLIYLRRKGRGNCEKERWEQERLSEGSSSIS